MINVPYIMFHIPSRIEIGNIIVPFYPLLRKVYLILLPCFHGNIIVPFYPLLRKVYLILLPCFHGNIIVPVYPLLRKVYLILLPCFHGNIINLVPFYPLLRKVYLILLPSFHVYLFTDVQSEYCIFTKAGWLAWDFKVYMINKLYIKKLNKCTNHTRLLWQFHWNALNL